MFVYEIGDPHNRSHASSGRCSDCRGKNLLILLHTVLSSTQISTSTSGKVFRKSPMLQHKVVGVYLLFTRDLLHE